ncbi:DUF192 domain-containing protein [Candidatus Uhrbacteria bacterium]|nr:DUF192 domain-containing protein [Candidatus Uhrbacteria bacterium]
MQTHARDWILTVVVLSALALVLILFPEVPFASNVTFVNGARVRVEVADTQAERVQGLSGHAPLGEEEGMLFLHEAKTIQGYWMKDMLFPLDIIWLDGATIVGFQENAPPENPAKTIYYSPVPVDRVLEVSAGFVAQNAVAIGDVLDVVLPDE